MDFQNFVNIIKSEFPEIDNDEIVETTVLQEVISLNSMNLAILSTTIELEFDRLIEMKELKNCRTFEDLFILINDSL